ncbi:hypothetical protein DXT76_01890 [Halobacillus trueperi]|uniref:Uncharacterized protein n=2 Tax=Halobacillus TaxID=45667 RepID=A0A1H0JKX8_HALAD|nr:MULTISPECIES: hypothetical protein [Halobacillus]RDY72446.1 hypothetical protein DXT76_01890 [Halobacillus trueperi]SDO44133.1 hypothetical protein SAMN05421677_10556 [Halobacillus aidingensis]
MIYVISTMAAVALGLFVLSFFMNDRMKELENQVEQVNMTMMQSNYQLKKKMKVLEEELLAEDLTQEIMNQPPKKKEAPQTLPLVDTVRSMYQKGYKTHYIAKQTNLSEHDVHSMIQQQKSGGVQT